jgi:hypothetical protein
MATLAWENWEKYNTRLLICKMMFNSTSGRPTPVQQTGRREEFREVLEHVAKRKDIASLTMSFLEKLLPVRCQNPVLAPGG